MLTGTGRQNYTVKTEGVEVEEKGEVSPRFSV